MGVISEAVQSITNAVHSCDYSDPLARLACLTQIQTVCQNINDPSSAHSDNVKEYVTNVCDMFISTLQIYFPTTVNG